MLKLEWWRLTRERHQANEAEAAHYLAAGMDADVEEEEFLRQLREQQWSGVDVDAMMADAIAREEEAEMDALVSGLEENWQGQGQGRQPDSPHFSDDDDYDGLFMDLISQQDGQAINHSQDVEMT